jgi:hypothetical protein
MAPWDGGHGLSRASCLTAPMRARPRRKPAARSIGTPRVARAFNVAGTLGVPCGTPLRRGGTIVIGRLGLKGIPMTCRAIWSLAVTSAILTPLGLASAGLAADLPIIPDGAVGRAVTWENRTGEVGGGGKTASHLGVGRGARPVSPRLRTARPRR